MHYLFLYVLTNENEYFKITLSTLSTFSTPSTYKSLTTDNMKYFSIFLIIILSLLSCKTDHLKSTSRTIQIIQAIDTSDMTNNFYDNTETYPLPVKELIVDGEIRNPGKVDFSELKLHSVSVKEALLDSTGDDRFVGAYRYDGYSFFDILNEQIINKSNADEFNPIIDLFIEVLN